MTCGYFSPLSSCAPCNGSESNLTPFRFARDPPRCIAAGRRSLSSFSPDPLRAPTTSSPCGRLPRSRKTQGSLSRVTRCLRRGRMRVGAPQIRPCRQGLRIQPLTKNPRPPPSPSGTRLHTLEPERAREGIWEPTKGTSRGFVGLGHLVGSSGWLSKVSLWLPWGEG